MKKKVLMALLMGLCVAATGCSQKTGETNSTTEISTQTETITEAAGSESSSEASDTESTETESAAGESEAAKKEEPEYRALDYVTLGQYKALEVTISSLDVTEEDIQEQYYTDCNSHDKLLQITEGEVADGDVTNIDYVGSVDGVEFDGGTDKGVDLTIGSGSFIPGFEEGLIGAPIGKKTDINVTFPESYEASLAGKDAVFEVTVNYVKKTPELTDEVVAEISDYKTVDEYRKALEDQIRTDKEYQQESDKINGILNLLYSGSTINDYPQAVVDYRVAEMKDYYTQIAEQADMDLDTFLTQQLQITEEQFDQQCPLIVKQSMIQELLLKAVAEAEEMELTDEEYEAGLEKYVADTGAESKETLLSQYSESELKRYLLMDKALDFLKENTTVKVEGESEDTTGAETEAETTTETASEAETEAMTDDTDEAGTETETDTASETETAAEETES